MTNYEKFTSMTVEELASFIYDCCDKCDYCAYEQYTCADDCEYGIINYLERQAED